MAHDENTQVTASANDLFTLSSRRTPGECALL